MAISPTFENQVKSILKNVADLRKFTAATAVYYRESTEFLRGMMEKTGVVYNTDIENLRLPFQDEALSYAFTDLTTRLMQYEKSSGFLISSLVEFDHQTVQKLSAIFDKDVSDISRHQAINEIVENLEELFEEKQNIIQLTREIEKSIRQTEIRLSAFFN